MLSSCTVCSFLCSICVCSGWGRVWGRWRKSTFQSTMMNMLSSCLSSGALNSHWMEVCVCVFLSVYMSENTHSFFSLCSYLTCWLAEEAVDFIFEHTFGLRVWACNIKSLYICMIVWYWYVYVDTVDSITPDKVRGLRDLLNSSAMDIMYYNSPLYRDEVRIPHFQL